MREPEHVSRRLAGLAAGAPPDLHSATASASAGPATRRLAPESVVTLFAVFSRRWAHKWEKTFVDEKARSLWRMDLENLGVTDASLRVGLQACCTLDWPPSPAEFAALCEPDWGLPEPALAFQEACHGRYPHEVIYEAARRLGLWELRHWSDAQGRREFMPVYAAVCREYRAGARWALPEARRITQKAKGPYAPDIELGRRAIAEMWGVLGKAGR